MDSSDTRQELLALTAKIVSSFVSNNSVAPADLPRLIAGVFSSLNAAAEPEAPKPAEAPTPGTT